MCYRFYVSSATLEITILAAIEANNTFLSVVPPSSLEVFKRGERIFKLFVVLCFVNI